VSKHLIHKDSNYSLCQLSSAYSPSSAAYTATHDLSHQYKVVNKLLMFVAGFSQKICFLDQFNLG
jgi:hypothetical protein